MPYETPPIKSVLFRIKFLRFAGEMLTPRTSACARAKAAIPDERGVADDVPPNPVEPVPV